MRKLFFLLVLASGMLVAQTPNATNTQAIGKFLKLSKVPSGLENDNVLVRGTDGIVKSVPRSEFGGGSQVNADWNATSGTAMILNKPIIPTVVPQVKTDWNAVSGLSQLLNKPVFKTINGNSIVGNGDITINTFNGYSIVFDGDRAPYWYNGQISLGNGNELAAWNATDSNIYWPQTPRGQPETLALSVNDNFADNNGNVSLSPITTTFTTNDGKTVTVTNGVITNIQ